MIEVETGKEEVEKEVDIREAEVAEENLDEDHILEVKIERDIIDQVENMIDIIEVEEAVIEREIKREEIGEIDHQVHLVFQVVALLPQKSLEREEEIEITEQKTKFQSNNQFIIIMLLIIGMYILTFKGKRDKKCMNKTKEQVSNDYFGMVSNG